MPDAMIDEVSQFHPDQPMRNLAFKFSVPVAQLHVLAEVVHDDPRQGMASCLERLEHTSRRTPIAPLCSSSSKLPSAAIRYLPARAAADGSATRRTTRRQRTAKGGTDAMRDTTRGHASKRRASGIDEPDCEKVRPQPRAQRPPNRCIQPPDTRRSMNGTRWAVRVVSVL